MQEYVILVDDRDREVGTAEKLQAHREGRLHRAFSVFVVSDRGDLLLQQRAPHKYHSGGLWTNTCCSHPRPGETTHAAAHRRLWEEMGIRCPLQEIFHFIYRIQFDNGLWEHEFDRVFVGRFNGDPQPNPDEATAWQWVALDALQADIAIHPERYTYWLQTCLDRFVACLDRRSSPP